MPTDLDDPLKSLAQIAAPDERQPFLVGSLEAVHAELSELELHRGVPRNVRQLFEAAKNVSLYSWFVYPFHQVAELIALASLEFALRTRDGFVEWDTSERKKPGLSQLLHKARRERWLTNAAFPSRRWMAIERASLKLVRAAMPGMTEGETREVRDPTEAEIMDAMSGIDVVQILVETAPKLRNNLAHGSSTLHPNSRTTLRLVAEAISQLFDSPQAPAESK
jgi:hypothetical protein